MQSTVCLGVGSVVSGDVAGIAGGVKMFGTGVMLVGTCPSAG